MQKSKVFLCVAFAASVSLAATVNIKPGMAGHWHEASSYAEEQLPALNDTVVIGAGVQATANKADIEWLAETLSPTGTISFAGTKTDATSSLTVTIGEGEEVDLPCLLTKANDYTETYRAA